MVRDIYKIGLLSADSVVNSFCWMPTNENFKFIFFAISKLFFQNNFKQKKFGMLLQRVKTTRNW